MLIAAPSRASDGNAAERNAVRNETSVPQLRSRIAWDAARAAEAAGRYETAARNYLKLACEHGDDVVPAGPGRYRPLTDWVLERVAGWPEPQRRMYAGLCASAGRAEMDRAIKSGDPDLMARTAARFAFAPVAEEAWLVAGDRLYAAGRLESALGCWTRLLIAHPRPQIGRNEILIRQSLALLHLGRSAKPALDELARCGAELKLAGRRVATSEAARLLAADADAVAVGRRGEPRWTSAADGWPEPAAHDARRGPSAIPETVLWRYKVGPDEPARRGVEEPPAPLLPAAGEDTLYVHDSRWAAALHRFTGKPIWRTRLAPEGNEELADSVPCAPTLDAKRMYLRAATEPGEADAFRRWDGPFGRLVCLDRRDGRILWTIGSFVPAPPGCAATDGSGRLDALTFDSAPLPFRGKLYVIVRRRPPRLRETVYGMCIDPNDGRVLWATPLADEGSESTARSTCVPTAAGDTVYFPTGVGALAAVNAESGRPCWIATYDRTEAEPEDPTPTIRCGAQRIERALVLADRLLLLPAHGTELLALDPAGGRRIAGWPKADLDQSRALVGVHAGVAVLTGATALGLDLASGEVRWRRPLPGGLCGAGMLSGGRLMVAAPTGPVVIGAVDGTVLSSGDERSRDWNAIDLVNHGDSIIAADVRGIASLANPDGLHDALAARLSSQRAHGAEAEGGTGAFRAPVLIAELSLQAGKPRRAADELAEALAGTGAAALPAEPADRARLFELMLALAARLEEDGRADRADDMFRLAAGCESSPADAARRLLALAACLERRGKAAEAVNACQSILAAADRRSAPAAAVGIASGPPQPTSTEARTAGDMARARIAALTAKAGAECYARHETEAEARLKQAYAADDPAGLLAVAAEYPNSRAAPEAIGRLADRLAAAGRPREAARLRRRLLGEFPAARPAAEVLAQMRADYAAAGAAELAAACGRAAELRGGGPRLPAPAGPAWPMRVAFRADLPDDAAAPASRTAAAQVGYLGSEKMGLRGAADGAALAEWEIPPGLAAAAPVAGRWAARTPEQILLYAPGRGEPVWTREFPVAADVPASGAAEARRKAGVADWLCADGLLTVRWGDGLIECIDPGGDRSDPAVLWSLRLPGEPSGQLLGCDGLMLAGAGQADGAAAWLIDLFAGRPLCRLRRTNSAWPSAIRWAGRQAVLIGSDGVEVYDVSDGRLLWRRASAGDGTAGGIVAAADRVYLCDAEARITAVDVRTGRDAWTLPAAQILEAEGPAGVAALRRTRLAAADGRLLIGNSAFLAAVDPRGGKVLWKTRLDDADLVREIIPGRAVVLVLASGLHPGSTAAVTVAGFDPESGRKLGALTIGDGGSAVCLEADAGRVLLLHRTSDHCRLVGLAPAKK